MAQWERRRVLVTVKAAPQVGKKHGESVCVAGVDLDRQEWIRLYPCHFRGLPFERRFSKYQVIEVDVRKASDARPESLAPRTAKAATPLLLLLSHANGARPVAVGHAGPEPPAGEHCCQQSP